MKKSRRLVSLAMAGTMSICAVPAASVNVSAHADSTVYTAGGFSKSEITLMNKIKTMIKTYDIDEIDISSYNLSMDDLWTLYDTVICNEPELLNANPGSIYASYETEDHVETFAINFRYNDRRTKSMMNEVDSFVDEMIAGMDTGWTDAEKVLYVHDYIASSCDYYEGTSKLKGRNIYEAFIKGSSVCVGYALGFQYVMDKLGIPCICVTSETHIWNMVKVDGNWYHVDVTWDDPEKVTKNLVFHDMLLLSEYALDNYETPHEQWDFGMTADSNKYDSFFWQQSASHMIYADKYWYYTALDGLYRYSFGTGKEERLYEFSEDDVWDADEGNYWTVSFGQVCEYKGKLYFNTSEKIKCYDPKTCKTRDVCSPKLQKGYQIFDITLEGDTLLIYAGTDLDSTAEKTYSYALSR